MSVGAVSLFQWFMCLSLELFTGIVNGFIPKEVDNGSEKSKQKMCVRVCVRGMTAKTIEVQRCLKLRSTILAILNDGHMELKLNLK